MRWVPTPQTAAPTKPQTAAPTKMRIGSIEDGNLAFSYQPFSTVPLRAESLQVTMANPLAR